MEQDVRSALYNQAKKWILEAGKIIRDTINDPIEIDVKANPNDLVTTMDKQTEQFFADKIKETYPNHLLFGEEGYGDEISSLDGTVWIIDPIDGTMNFVHQKRNFAISIGIFQDGIGEIGLIYDVMNDILYHAKRGEGAFKNNLALDPLKKDVKFEEAILALNHFWLCENTLIDEKVMQDLVKTVRGTRTMGSAALEMAYVAEGIVDAYLAIRLSPWDVAAGLVILNEVGGATTNHLGKALQLLESDSLVACNQTIQQRLLDDYLTKGGK